MPAAAGTSAASSAAPATSAPAFDNRAVCRKNVDTANALDLAPDTNVANGNHAAESDNPGIARAGSKLVDAATEAQTATDTAGANLNIRQAQRDLAEACASLFGDGPW